MFSIVLPFYNSEGTIYKAVDSILSQSFIDFELIIVNDGSKDNSEKILKENFLKDERIKYFKNDNNGVSYTRNYGITKASNDYILFIDSDDYVEVDYLKEISNDLKNNENNFVIQGFKRVDNLDNLLYTKSFKNRHIKSSEILEDDLLLYLTPFCKVFDRMLLISNNLKFREDLTYAEDNIFVLEYISKSNKTIYLSNVSNYNYVLFNNSLSSRLLQPENYYMPLKVIDDIMLNHFKLDVLQVKSHVLADKYVSLLNMFVNSVFIHNYNSKVEFAKLSDRDWNVMFQISKYSSLFRRIVTFLIKIKQYTVAKFLVNTVLKNYFKK